MGIGTDRWGRSEWKLPPQPTIQSGAALFEFRRRVGVIIPVTPLFEEERAAIGLTAVP
jgi:hypothetical protein